MRFPESLKIIAANGEPWTCDISEVPHTGCLEIYPRDSRFEVYYNCYEDRSGGINTIKRSIDIPVGREEAQVGMILTDQINEVV